MCGIAGILDLTGGNPVDLGRLRRMTDALVHRGPDIIPVLQIWDVVIRDLVID
jgi:asparagine synthetase B (glutamine-hydrolysing)